MLYGFSLLKSFFWLVGCDCCVLRRAPFLMAAHSFGFYRKKYAKAVP